MNGCYAQGGLVALGHAQMEAAYKRGKDYSLKTALLNRHPSSKYVRFGALGDPSSLNKTVFKRHWNMVKRAGLGILNFTHFWKTRGSWLKGYAMASCDTWEQVEQAVKKGWRAAIWTTEKLLDNGVRKGVYNGIKFVLCPHQAFPEKKITCNSCGLCCGDKTHLVPVVVFQKH